MGPFSRLSKYAWETFYFKMQKVSMGRFFTCIFHVLERPWNDKDDLWYGVYKNYSLLTRPKLQDENI